MRLQRGSAQQKMSSGKAIAGVERHATAARLARMDDADRQNLHPSPLPLPRIKHAPRIGPACACWALSDRFSLV